MGQKVGMMVALVAIGTAILLGLLDVTNMLPELRTQYGGFITVVLVIAGLIIGYMNIDSSESLPFMLAAIGLNLGIGRIILIPTFGAMLQTVAGYVLSIILPALVVVACKVIYTKARN